MIMTKQCKELLKYNNKREKEINKINERIYTDMIVYLRGSDMTEYNQELIREDLITMILEGQERGDDIEKVIGNNYKDICDEIIETMPKKTKLQKLGSVIETTLASIWILGAISIIKTLIGNLFNHEESWNFILSIGDLINMLIIILLANFIVNYVCKTAFQYSDKNKVLTFIKVWIVSIAISGTMIMCSYYLDYTIVHISLILAALIVGIIFILDKILCRYTV